MIVSCHQCGRVFHKAPSQIRDNNFCSNVCRLEWWRTWTAENMNIPGHSKGHKAPHLTRINQSRTGRAPMSIPYDTDANRRLTEKYDNCLINPMHFPAIRKKVSEKLRDRGKGRTYRKYFGRHEHRVVAEQKLGRPLKDGEVVHHIDGDKRNNEPQNLMIITRAEHAKIHFSQKRNELQDCARGGD